MDSNNCPHCGEVAISFLKKAVCSPAKSFDCPECGEHIGISISGSITYMFVVIAAIKVLALLGLELWSAFSMGMVLCFVIQAFLVKLVTKERHSGVDLGL